MRGYVVSTITAAGDSLDQPPKEAGLAQLLQKQVPMQSFTYNPSSNGLATQSYPTSPTWTAPPSTELGVFTNGLWGSREGDLQQLYFVLWLYSFRLRGDIGQS